MTDATPPRPTAVREPVQGRSRASWQRILEAGTALLEEEGFEALTIAAVCKQARVSAPTIYARVDGLAGLFWAIYERGMVGVIQVQRRYATAALSTSPSSPHRIAAVVDIAAKTFEEQSRFLRPIVRFASSNEALLGRGAVSSRELVDTMAGLLPGDPADAVAIARMVYAECVFRLVYGDHFLGPHGESFEEFRGRLTRLALAGSGLAAQRHDSTDGSRTSIGDERPAVDDDRLTGHEATGG